MDEEDDLRNVVHYIPPRRTSKPQVIYLVRDNVVPFRNPSEESKRFGLIMRLLTFTMALRLREELSRPKKP